MIVHESRTTIVVVEDDVVIRELLTDELEVLGYVVKTAGSAAEAVEICAATPRVHLLLLDWQLPDGTGQEVLDGLARGGRGEIPVVVMTGHLLTRRLPAQVRETLHKPFDLTMLVEAVQGACGPAIAVHAQQIRPTAHVVEWAVRVPQSALLAAG